ncbi:MAG: DUF1015 domain-containing protein [Candidatus Thorarchaeota archaeon]
MVRVVPFRAFRYNEEKVGDLSKVVSPPYDIIKGKKVDNFQSRSKYNIVWIIKNKPEEKDNPTNNPYTRARDLLSEWVDQGVMKQDEKESFYVYGQNFNVEEKDLFRFGFIGLIALEDFAKNVEDRNSFTGVLQHEETLPKDIADRLDLCRNSMAQFGQIFVIYPDTKQEVDSVLEKNMQKEPITDITDEAGVRHRIWMIDDKTDTDAITAAMADKYVIIADGHHRYKTALALMRENPNLESAKYRMLTFVNISNPGLVVLPTHRLVQNLDNFSKEDLLTKVSDYFDVAEFESKEDMFQLMDDKFEDGLHSFGLFMDDGKFYTLTLNDTGVMDEILSDKSPELRKLDVAILHALLLDKMLGIGKEKLAQGTMTGGGYVVYIKGIGDAVEEAIKSVKGDAQSVFFMNPTRVHEVEAVSNNLETMPQKSTFFHPKVWTGFCINKLK